MPYVPDSVFESGVWGTLNGTETKVYITLCQHYNKKDRIAYPSMLRIAKLCGSDKSHVVRTVASLCEKGLVIKKKRENPYGQDFNYYILPDFLLYEYSQLKKDPRRNTTAIVEITNLLMEVMAGVKLTPAGVKKASGGVKNTSKPVLNPHPNYIINYIINHNTVVNSFNSTKKHKPKKEETIVSNEEHNGFQKKLRLFNLKLGNNRKLKDEEIENILPQLNRDINFNTEEKESIKIGLRTGIIGRSI